MKGLSNLGISKQETAKLVCEKEVVVKPLKGERNRQHVHALWLSTGMEWDGKKPAIAHKVLRMAKGNWFQ